MQEHAAMAQEQGTKPDFLAGNRSLGASAPFQLFAGEEKITTDRGTVGPAAVRQYEVIALDGAGLIVPYTAADGQQAVGVAANAAPAGSPLAYYVAAFFNHLALEWPASVSSLAARKKVFERTTIRIGTLPNNAPTL